MQRYYFHLVDGEDVLLDPEGKLLPSLLAVAAAALFEARELVAADARTGLIRLDYRIDVEDEKARIVHSVAFTDAVKFAT